MSRPSLTQIESGKRRIEIFELYQLSVILEFSLDEFMAPCYKVSNEIPSEKKPSIRESNIEPPYSLRKDDDEN
jgi:hypothetical protein